jgi:hypothetical protein
MIKKECRGIYEAQLKLRDKLYYQDHKGYYNELSKKYRLDHSEQCKKMINIWRLKHPELTKAYDKKWRETHPDKMKTIRGRHNDKRRGLGFIPLNKPFSGSVRHHIDNNHFCYIPYKLHRSIPHCLKTGDGMTEINAKVFAWLNQA